jgi:hypothetical protein
MPPVPPFRRSAGAARRGHPADPADARRADAALREHRAPRQGRHHALGAKDFDGVKAEGKSTCGRSPPARSATEPDPVTSESWYSPDLKVTVYSRYNDPRTGESIYRLAGIRRAEPARDLFSVPPATDARARKREERK